MDIDIVFRIAATGILLTVLDIVLAKAGREDVAMLVTLAGLVVILLMVVDMIDGLFSSVKRIFDLG